MAQIMLEWGAIASPPDKDLESPSSTRLEALVPSRDSRANQGGLRGPCCALGGRHCGWELTESTPGAGIVSCRGGGGGPSYRRPQFDP